MLTPQTIMLGETDLGARQSDPALRTSFNTIRARSLRLFRQVKDILLTPHSASGQLQLKRRRVVLQDVALSEMALNLRRARVSVTLDLPASDVLRRLWQHRTIYGTQHGGSIMHLVDVLLSCLRRKFADFAVYGLALRTVQGRGLWCQ